MILLQNYTPDVYYRQSRDFQLLGRLYDAVLNAVKTNTDMIYDIPASDSAGSKLIDLLTLTMGFKAIHSYNVKQLTAVCSVLPTILRNKGSEKSIEMVCQAALTAEGVITPATVRMDDDKHNLTLYIPQALSDITLIWDLLYYILPAGITVNLVRTAGEERSNITQIPYAGNVLDVWQVGVNAATVPTVGQMEANVAGIGSGDVVNGDEDRPGMTTNTTVLTVSAMSQTGDDEKRLWPRPTQNGVEPDQDNENVEPNNEGQ